MRSALAAILFLGALGVSSWLQAAADPSPARPVSSPARRIVGLDAAQIELCYALGAGDRVVAVTDYCDWPPETRDLPRVGGRLNADLEHILALAPDTVLLMRGHQDLARSLRAFGVDARMRDMVTWADLLEAVMDLGAQLGAPDRAAALRARFEQGMAQVRASAQGRPTLRVLVVVSHVPGSLREVYAAGEDTYLDDLVRAAGGRNVLADQSGYPGLAQEAILALDPDVIVDLVAPGTFQVPSVAELQGVWARYGSLRAVREGRVYCRIGSAYVVPGPRFLGVMEDLAACVQGVADE